jgi:hypothetical protein
MSTSADVAIGLLGAAVILTTLLSAISMLVLPRGVNTRLSRAVFTIVSTALGLAAGRRDRLRRDRMLALVAPISLIMLPPLWLTLVWIGFGAVYLAVGVADAWTALRLSGSSLLTLGFAVPEGATQTGLTFVQAVMGLGLLTLLIAYLPTMYSAFSQREAQVALLEVRAGSPPSAIEMLERFRRIGQDDSLDMLWRDWEYWFAQLDETHTSLAALPFFRSPAPDRSWVTAAGTVLDAASLYQAAIRHGPQPAAGLCIRAGYTTLRRICDLYGIDYPEDPAPNDPISLTREEFDAVFERLTAVGFPMVDDRDQAWRDFSGWRVNYDRPLLSLALLVEAPWAPWTSDRSPPGPRPRLHRAPRRPG